MNKTVSIVVPIYNVENYLEKCINSIVDQTYRELEIILVDDGSKDGSPDICNNWKEKDSRIRVIHKVNGGLSSARNAGLEVASGEYIMFEDSDDWLENDIVEKCVERIEKDDSDMVIFGYKKVDEKGKELGSFTFGNKTYSQEELSEQLHRRILEMSFGYAWNKLYRLSVIKESGVKNDLKVIDREDLHFNLKLLVNINKISFIEEIGYNYLQRRTSLLHNYDTKRLDGVNIFVEKMHSLSWNDSKSEMKVFNMTVLHYISDCIVKNIIWNKNLRKKEAVNTMQGIVDRLKYKNELFYDMDNPRYLNILYKAIKEDNMKVFYRYVKLSYYKNRLAR